MSSEVSKIDEICMMGPQGAHNPAKTDSKPANIEFPHSFLSSPIGIQKNKGEGQTNYTWSNLR